MPVTTAVDPKPLLEAVRRRVDEPPAFAALRQRALESYLDSPLPERVAHLWRYSDPQRFAPAEEALLARWTSRPAAGAGKGAELPAILKSRLAEGELGGAVLLEASGATRVELASGVEKQGVRVLSLHEAMRDAPELVEEHLGRAIGAQVGPSGQGKFEALNLALWSAGVLVHVPRNVRVEKPIHVFLPAPAASPTAPPGGDFAATRILVVIGAGSELTLVDECQGGAGLQLNSVVEVFAGEGARARHVAVQQLGKSVLYHAAQRVEAGRDAHCLTAMASLGSAATKSDFGSFLSGPGANVELWGFLFGEGKQHFDHHTVHDHRAGHTCSNLDFKVVLRDQARSAYTGLIRIEPNAPESEAYQENRNLLLNEGARAESIPELEILTDAVKCTHGATVGTLDALHVFYLMCRGLQRPEAVRLVVGGFIEPTLSRLPPDLSQRLRGHVEERLASL